MKDMLIIYPHWPPSNLAGMHRPRLISNFISEFGWNPVILTVDSQFYEERPDNDMTLLVRDDIEVFYTKAFRATKPRIIGDIGIRAFYFLFKKARHIIKERKIRFIWIPIPSFYTSLLGRLLHEKTGIPYGIDYIDPWIRDISNQRDLRHRLSILTARILEPIAVKKATLITGVSFAYYKPVLKRNFKKITCRKFSEKTNSFIAGSGEDSTFLIHHSSFPYGFDSKDHQIKLNDLKLPWAAEKKIKPWIYAGAFLPNSRWFLELFFKAVSELRSNKTWDSSIRFYFLGTGQYKGTSIIDYAKEYGLGDMVFEDRTRYPYLQVLNFLSASDTVMILGSTEKHYTASKVYQALLSKRPVWAIFHTESSAVKVMEECKADSFLVRFHDGDGDAEIMEGIIESLQKKTRKKSWQPDLSALDKYSARESARKLAKAMDTVINERNFNKP